MHDPYLPSSDSLNQRQHSPEKSSGVENGHPGLRLCGIGPISSSERMVPSRLPIVGLGGWLQPARIDGIRQISPATEWDWFLSWGSWTRLR